MSNIEEEDQSKPIEKEPIFLERGDGLGWTLNFDRPISYVILFLILGATLAVCIYLFVYVK